MPPEEHIPRAYAVLPYYLTAAISFVLVVLLVCFSAEVFTGHYFQPKLLAITHLAALGWITMIIFGASNQLVPVVSEQRLFSNRIAGLVFLLKVPGVILLVFSFWQFTLAWMAYVGGILLLSSFLMQSYNLFQTVKNAQTNIINDFILTAHVWLVLTGIIGLMLLVNLRFPFLPEEHLHYLKLHASIGMAGWFLQLVVGVSARLIPMFLLSRGENTRLLSVTFYCFNLTLILFLMESMVLKLTLGRTLYVLIVLVGLIFYLRYVIQCYKTAARKQMDQGMKQTFLALFVLLLPILALSFILFIGASVPVRFIVVYGFAYFFGFLSILIMGQTFKTLPFIVWMHITRSDQLPKLLPKDLFRESWVQWQALLYIPGFFLFSIGILLQLKGALYGGGLLMTFGAVWYCVHVCIILLKLKSK